MAIIHVDDTTFEKEVVSNDIVLVDFYADWCGPCRALAPILEELDSDCGSTKIIKVNVDEAEKTARKFGVMSIPTIILFKNGKEVSKKIGLCSKEELLELMQSK